MFMNRPAVFVALIVALALAWPAGAHPFGPKYYSFRTIVELDGPALKLTTAVEAPTLAILGEYAKRYGHLEEIGEKEDREFFESMLAQIGEGLAVTVDGKPVPGKWVPSDSPINGRADEKFFYYIVTFEADGALPDGPCELRVTNQVFADEEAYYSGWIKPAGGWTVTETNLQALGTAAQAEDVSTSEEAWSKDAALRDLVATLEPKKETP
jgi:hypothetical protein